jgi:hypothetical protein
MWPAVIIAVSIVVVLLALYVASRGRYYSRIFSEGSFREFHDALARAIEAAQGKGPEQPPSPDDGTGFVTSAGIAAGVTCTRERDGTQILHISLSQAGQITTHALCSRFGFFATTLLGNVKGSLTPYFTDSGVHHLVFRFSTAITQLEGFDSCYARYVKEYKPIPFRHEKLIGTTANRP